jgi:hypothetical protein
MTYETGLYEVDLPGPFREKWGRAGGRLMTRVGSVLRLLEHLSKLPQEIKG